MSTRKLPLGERREQARRRRRRLIHNNDGDDISFEGSDTPEGFLSHRCQPLLGTQVDTLCYGTGVTTLFHHDSEVAETLESWGLDGSERDPYVRNQRALREQGLDSLRLVADFAHVHDLEVLWSHRMNDVHDSAPDHEWILARHKREHPELLMGTPAARQVHQVQTPRWWWSAYDFERSEILDHLCAIQSEVCERYEIDGVECDYFRNPMFFRTNLDFEPATGAQVAVMTQFQRRLRGIHLAAGEARDRLLLTAVRVPATEERCLYTGIDIRTWLAEGLVDLLFVSGGYLPFTEPVGGLLGLAGAFDVPAYVSFNTPLLTRDRERPLESLRGAAQNAWQAGADGLQLFNCFDGWYDRRWVADIGSPATLEGTDKVFGIDRRGWIKGAYRAAIVQDHGLSIEIAGGASEREIHLPVGDDLPAAAAGDASAGLELTIGLEGGVAADGFRVALNGSALAAAATDVAAGLWRFELEAASFVHGRNVLRLGADQATSVTRIELHVRY